MADKEKKELLVDRNSSSGSLRVVESVDTPTGEYTNGVLCTLEGPLSDFSKPTRNNRWYSGDLWRRVLDSDYFKEMMETNTLFGEPDHPLEVESRDDIHIPYVSHAIRDVYIDEEKQMVMGKLDILDTPYGRILKTLVDYGSILGVSSRGNGTISNTPNGPTVDPDNYRFITWDVVAYPSNDKARQTKITESGGKSLYESLIQQVDKMLDTNTSKVDSLQLTKSLITNSGVPEKSKLLEYINTSIETIREGGNADTDPIDTYEGEGTHASTDLQEALDRIVELRQVITEQEVTEKKLHSIIETQEDTISELEEDVRKLTDKVSSLMDDLAETISKTEKLDKLDNLDEYMSNAANADDTDTEEIVDEVESRTKDMLHDMLEAVVVLMETKSDDVIRSVGGLKRDIHEMQTKVIKSTAANELRESPEQGNMKQKVKELLQENKELVRQLSEYEMAKTGSSKVTEEYREAYLENRCSQLGVNPKLVRSMLEGNESPSEVDNIIRSMYKSDGYKTALIEGRRSSRMNESRRVDNEEPPRKVVVVNENKDTESDNSIVGIISAMSNNVKKK